MFLYFLKILLDVFQSSSFGMVHFDEFNISAILFLKNINYIIKSN